MPPYTMHMRAKGFEKTRECGRRRNEAREVLREFLRVAWPEAFCIIPLPTLSVLGRGKGERHDVLVNYCD